MKIRGIHIRGHKSVSDISLDFRGIDGHVSPLIGITGSNGSGKSLVAKAMGKGWAASVQDRDLSHSLGADLCRLDFEHVGEMFSIHIRGDKVDASVKLVGLFDAALNRHMIVKYDAERVLRLPMWVNRTSSNMGIQAIWPILSDLHDRDVRDSVIIIDDFDMGLDNRAKKDLFAHLRNHHRSKNNQVILFMRDKIAKADGLWLELEGRADPMEGAMKGFSEKS